MSAALSSLGILLIIGAPVAFALAIGGFAYLWSTDTALSTLASHLFSTLNSATIMTIPFFILAADILSRCGATRDLVALVTRVVGGDRGMIPVVAVLSCTFFAAICGSSTATAAAIGVVLIPEMIRHGYDKKFAVGLIATAGGLGMLIPPSIPLIIYGLVTETSISKLFQAAMGPGLFLAALLCAIGYIVGRRMAPVAVSDANVSSAVDAGVPARAYPLIALPFIVLGGIYFGFFTPIEASAVSVVYALAIAVLIYRTSWRGLADMLSAAAATSSIILLILAGAALVGYAMTAERIPHHVFNWISSFDVSSMTLLFALAGCLLLVGMMLEVLSIILIAMPILLPLLLSNQIDVVMFAVLLIVNMELAVITPPIGLNLFVISSISGVKVHDVFIGTLPFALTLLAFLGVLILWFGF